ncbi:helix-turn-helix transcriptional regulator [Microbacterium testaceum]|uniref:helix-turn-helix transcriptional regulator n=1 Tax=Microbacterium testaceum TaxID=2033 RepID=UPI001D17A1CC|nr:helix-turn-helix transcriptional regulator [Microbacterium testaceum]MCC4250309.1 helix-turn-helix transcriptional regulator [Microbacterium testaceum]
MGEVLTVRATGAGDVEAVWQQFIPSARLDRVDPVHVRFEWSSIESGTFSLVQYSLRADVRSSIQLDDQIMACQLAALDGRVFTNDRDIDPRQPWIAGDGPMHGRWSGTGKVRAFLFDRTSAERVARAVSGDDRLVLRAIDPVARDRMLASQWERSFGYVASALVSGHEHPLVAAELERHALLSTLTTFSTTYLEALDRAGQRAAAPRTVRRALAFIDSHAHLPITIDDIAEAAGISTRGLQHAFRRALDTTPSAYLRTVRLTAAHRDLHSGDDSVGEVARRWGFSSPSRFARYYREVYGRNPSQTARMF